LIAYLTSSVPLWWVLVAIFVSWVGGGLTMAATLRRKDR
jgi:uncharacterized membrane protein